MIDSNTQQINAIQPIRLSFGWLDWYKLIWQWLLAFKRNYIITPGLYYTGDSYQISAPLLVTSNYHLTVWSVWRRIKRQDVRLLVIDTDGINVWCAAGKGRFNADEILRQIYRYPHSIISETDQIKLILPKLSLSGVKLTDLRQQGIQPVIGPVYAGDLPEFLTNVPYRDCNKQRFEFDLVDRIFTLLPSWVQILAYSTGGAILLFLLNLWLQTGIWWQIIPLSLMISSLYILFFPILPTRSFVYKGITLFMLIGSGYGVYHFLHRKDIWETAFYLCYMAGFSIFFGLYYTGNSGVSNYTRVKKETLLFLPMVIGLFIAALATLFIKGV